MWIVIDLLGLLSLAACVMTAVAQGIFYAELLTFSGLMFIAGMIDRLRWTIEHKGGDDE